MCIDGLIPFTPRNPSRDELIDLIVAAIERAEKSGISEKPAVAALILRDLKTVGLQIPV